MKFPLFLLVLFSVFVLSCASTQRQQRSDEEIFSQEPDLVVQKEWKSILALTQHGDWKVAQSKAQGFQRRFPLSPLAIEAKFFVARAQYAQGQYGASRESFRKFLEAHVGHARSNEARYGLALSLYKLNVLQESSTVLSTVAKEMLPVADQLFAFYLSGKLLTYQGRYFEGTSDYLKAYDRSGTDETMRKNLSDIVIRGVEQHLTVEDLNRLRSERQGLFPESKILMQLAKRAESNNQSSDALEYYETLVGKFPEQKDSSVQKALDRLRADDTAEMRSIGVLLPLTGQFEEFGRAALRGIQTASGMFSGAGGAKGVRLVIRDTQGNSEIAREAFRELVDEQKVAAIVGPLTSKEAEFVAEMAQDRQVPLMVLSQKAGVTEVGDFIFRASMTLRLQAQTLAREAVSRLGIKRFAVMYPKAPYGVELAREFIKAVEEQGGIISAKEDYPLGETDFREHVRRLTQTFYPSQRREEWARLKQMQKDNARSRRVKDVQLPPIVDFEALFIADDYKAVGQIAPTLDYLDVSGITLIGPSAWHSRQLLSRAKGYIDGALFVDGFFAGSKRPGVGEFVKRYKSLFRQSPDIHVAQGYDSAALVLQALERSKATSRRELRDALAETSNYEGPSGVMHGFDDHRESDKTLFVLTARGNDIVER